MAKSNPRRYILIGAADDLSADTLLDFPSVPASIALGALAGAGMAMEKTRGLRSALKGIITSSGQRDPAIKIVRSLHENGPKLVEMEPSDALALRAAKPGVKVIDEVFYRLASFDLVRARLSRKAARSKLANAALPKSGAKGITVRVTDKEGKPIVGATVVAYWNLDAELEDHGETKKDGAVRLRTKEPIERLYVQPRSGYWSRTLHDLSVEAGQELPVVLESLDLSYEDGLKYFYGAKRASAKAGEKVRVAVIDGGVGPHPDVEVSSGQNFTGTESETLYEDNGIGHGTHVAGIIAGRSDGKRGYRGLAPGVELFSYRVCSRNDENLSNFALGAAIEAAVKSECHLINLSLAQKGSDEYVELCVGESWKRGCLVIAAAGNERQEAVGFPAAMPTAIGVSAFGRKQTFPKDAAESETIDKPLGDDKKNFFASFSNRGPGLDFTAPGVGIVSTFPGGGYATMSGTSMACPVVTGMAARLFSEHPEVLALPATQARSEAMAKLLFSRAKPLGFGAHYEGYGLCVKI